MGKDKKITVVYTLGGADAHKYTAPENYVLNIGDISAKQLTAIPIFDKSMVKVYDGTTNLEGVNISTSSGIVDGDDVKILAKGTYDTPDVGTGKTVTVTYWLVGSMAYNYIAPKPLIIQGAGVIEAKK